MIQHPTKQRGWRRISAAYFQWIQIYYKGAAVCKLRGRIWINSMSLTIWIGRKLNILFTLRPTTSSSSILFFTFSYFFWTATNIWFNLSIFFSFLFLLSITKLQSKEMRMTKKKGWSVRRHGNSNFVFVFAIFFLPRLIFFCHSLFFQC